MPKSWGHWDLEARNPDCREWGIRRNLVWGKLAKGETVKKHGKIWGLFQGNELRSLLGIWANLSHLVSVCQHHSSGPISHNCKAEKCLLASGAICLLSSWNWSYSWASKVTPKVQIPELFGSSGQPLWLSRKGWGYGAEKPQIEVETRIHTNPGLVLYSLHWMETGKFWGKCYKEEAPGPCLPRCKSHT